MLSVKDFRVFMLSAGKALIKFTDPETGKVSEGVTTNMAMVNRFFYEPNPTQDTFQYLKNVAINF